MGSVDKLKKSNDNFHEAMHDVLSDKKIDIYFRFQCGRPAVIIHNCFNKVYEILGV